ncbi:hypothetical protein [Blastococcus montanus]|uniref:hypothetical protein n=1 Tax=Blastococcus montanus TaxID=3144973 RepID=UPI003209229D
MSTPENPPPSDEVSAAIRALDRELRRLRVPRRRRAELLAEVRTDLRAAADDGVPPRALLADVETFARDAVAARGWGPRPRDRWAGTGVALLAGGAALVVGYLVVVELLTPLFSRWFELDGSYPVAGAVLAVVLMALAGLGGALAAYAGFLSGRPAARPSVKRAAWYLPLGAALGVVGALAYGHSQDYATAPPVVTTEVLLVALPCAAALWLARSRGLRSETAPEGVSAG